MMKSKKPCKYQIWPSISFPENKFIELYGADVYDNLKTKTANNWGCKCASCEYTMNTPNWTVEEFDKRLQTHIIQVDEQNPENSKTVLLCRECHITQHIDIAIKKNWVELVNSKFTQGELISQARHTLIAKGRQFRQIVTVKMTPIELLSEIKSGTYDKRDRVKMLFTESYKDWDAPGQM